jgi:hypothetical protein
LEGAKPTVSWGNGETGVISDALHRATVEDFREGRWLNIRELLLRGESSRSIAVLVGKAQRGQIPGDLQERLTFSTEELQAR